MPNDRKAAASQRARDPGSGTQQRRWFDHQKSEEDDAQHRGFVADRKQLPQPSRKRLHPTDYPEHVEERPRTEHDRERCDILALRKIPGVRTNRIHHQFRRGHPARHTDIVQKSIGSIT